MTNKILMTSIIATTLILSTFSFAEKAQASVYEIDDEISCVGFGGVFSLGTFCTLTNFTIDLGDQLEIRGGIHLVTDGTNINNGSIIHDGNTNPFAPGEWSNLGILTNNGTIELNGNSVSLSGQMINAGTLVNNNLIIANGGVGDNSGKISSSGIIENNGSIVLNAGTGNFSGILLNQGILNIGCFSNIDGTVDDLGTIIVEEDCNTEPDCSEAYPSTDMLYQDDTIWPPNHKMETIFVLGVTDPENDPVTIRIDSIFQDEPIDGLGNGDQSPDGAGIGTNSAQVRAERSGEDNGRVYHIEFTAEDILGATCSSEVIVDVPHDKKSNAVDDGSIYDSTLP